MYNLNRYNKSAHVWHKHLVGQLIEISFPLSLAFVQLGIRQVVHDVWKLGTENGHITCQNTSVGRRPRRGHPVALFVGEHGVEQFHPGPFRPELGLHGCLGIGTTEHGQVVDQQFAENFCAFELDFQVFDGGADRFARRLFDFRFEFAFHGIQAHTDLIHGRLQRQLEL